MANVNNIGAWIALSERSLGVMDDDIKEHLNDCDTCGDFLDGVDGDAPNARTRTFRWCSALDVGSFLVGDNGEDNERECECPVLCKLRGERLVGDCNICGEHIDVALQKKQLTDQ